MLEDFIQSQGLSARLIPLPGGTISRLQLAALAGVEPDCLFYSGLAEDQKNQLWVYLVPLGK
ncbi:MAG: hypothetical protein HY917_04980, partial [Candidatus Diapherotrites archaeon]|nr:hypothetical protein [Candidatus Diapherotrites archaeon]